MTTAYNIARRLPNLPPMAEMSLEKKADHMMQVIGFHSLYNVPMAPLQSEDPEFKHMSNERVSLRLGLITEELAELLRDGFGIEMQTTYTVTSGGREQAFNEQAMKSGKALDAAERAGRYRNGLEVADALGDLVYVIYGFALEMGYDLRAVIQEIHASNLTKLGEDGQPVLRDDGKVLKGPNYVLPNIREALGWED